MKNMLPFLSAKSGVKSLVFGAPDDFDFLAALEDARSVKCAIAFGHMTGWKKIEPVLKASKGKTVQILLGQAFLQTEPDLLDLFRIAEEKNSRFQGRLAPVKPTFHPKVWIIITPAKTHLIIGSANLSHGGFISNSECSAYLDDLDSVASIEGWFDECWKESSRLTAKVCKNYREQYERVAPFRKDLQKEVDAAADNLQLNQNRFRRDDAVKEARRYFSTQKGEQSAQERHQAMKLIRDCLQPPLFNFTKEQWLRFLSIDEFGSLHRIPRSTGDHLSDLRRAFRRLADDSIPLETRFNDVVPINGRLHVHDIGQNIATKVMAMLHPDKMPVYNVRVEKTLVAFGYSFEKSRSEGWHYSEFCRQVQDFAAQCGLDEVLSMDAFFEHYSRR